MSNEIHIVRRGVLVRRKTLDGLLEYISKRLAVDEYIALIHRADSFNMTLREYVHRRFEQWQPPARRES